MKREILFKAKRVDNGEWVEGDLINLDDRIMISGKDMPAYDNGDIYCNVELMCVEVHPETVCQFTGLLDKNGNKIFEGDILESINHFENRKPYKIHHIIQWSEKFNGWFAKHEDNLGKENTNGDIQLWVYLKKTLFEITGNIHDK